MKNMIKSWTRPSRKWTDIFLIAAILSVILFYGGDLISFFLFRLIPLETIFRLITSSEDTSYFMLMYFSYIGAWILFFLICGIIKSNRPILKQLAPNKNGNNLKGVLWGLLLGFGANGFCILMSVLMGNIHLSFNEFNPLVFFTFLFVVAVQSGAEEILLRVYLYQKLRRRYRNPLVAIVGNSFVFTVLHLFNPGITPLSVICILEIGILYALLVYYYDSVWAAIMAHTWWNFTQNIIFGLPNSGIVSEYSLFKLDAASAENGLFYNVGFGVEGSLGSLLINGIVLVAIILINRGKPEKNDVWGKITLESTAQQDAQQV